MAKPGTRFTGTASSRRRMASGLVLSLFIFLVLLGLGSWQVYRLQAKLELIAERDAMMQSPPITIATPADLAHMQRDGEGKLRAAQPVKLIGRVLPGYAFFLGNKFAGEASGFDVLVPVILEPEKLEPVQLKPGQLKPEKLNAATLGDDGENAASHVILVDMGFIAWPKTGNYNPMSLYRPPADQTAPRAWEGWVVLPNPPGRFTPMAKPSQYLWYSADLSDMAAKNPELKTLNREFLLKLRPGAGNESGNETGDGAMAAKPEDAATPRPQNLPELKNPHLGYAVTWFGLAVIWGLFCVALGRQSWRSPN